MPTGLLDVQEGRSRGIGSYEGKVRRRTFLRWMLLFPGEIVPKQRIFSLSVSSSRCCRGGESISDYPAPPFGSGSLATISGMLSTRPISRTKEDSFTSESPDNFSQASVLRSPSFSSEVVDSLHDLPIQTFQTSRFHAKTHRT